MRPPDQRRPDDARGRRMGLGITIGATFGIWGAAVFDNLALGFGTGIAMGVAIGADLKRMAIGISIATVMGVTTLGTRLTTLPWAPASGSPLGPPSTAEAGTGASEPDLTHWEHSASQSPCRHATLAPRRR